MLILINHKKSLTRIPKAIKPKVIYSVFKGDCKKGEFEFISNNPSDAITLNNFFWQMRMKKTDNKYTKVIISNIEKYEIEKSEINDPSDKNDFNIIKYKNRNLYYIELNNLKIMNTPCFDYYFKEHDNRFKEYVSAWIYELSKKYSSNVTINKQNAYGDNLKNKYFKKKRDAIYNKNTKIINGGNEGVIYKDGEYLIKKSFPKKMDDNHKNSNLSFGHKEFENLHKELQLKYYFKNEKHVFRYKDVIFPTSSINFPEIARLLRITYSKKLLISDNKIENFGKLHVSDNVYKLIFNDFGSSLYKSGGGDGDDDLYYKFFEGIVRDNFFLVKEQKNSNVRNIIRDMRSFESKELIDNDIKFKRFWKAVFNYNKEENKYICHSIDNFQKFKEGNLNKAKICPSNSTMSIMRRKNGSNFIYDLDEDKVFECKRKEIINLIKHKYNMIPILGTIANLSRGVVWYEIKK